MNELGIVALIFFIAPIMFARQMFKRYSDDGTAEGGVFKLGKGLFNKAKERGVTDKVADSVFKKLFGK